MEFEIEVVGGAHFEDEVVSLDGREFDSCTMVNCTLIYQGGFPFIFTKTVPVDCEFSFEGPARNTLETLACMHRFGMHKLVEGMFDKVRNPTQETVQ